MFIEFVQSFGLIIVLLGLGYLLYVTFLEGEN